MKQEFASTIRTGGPALRRSLYLLDCAVHFLNEIVGSLGAALPIPPRSLFRFFNRRRMYSKRRVPAHSAAEESLRRNSSRDTGLTLPESKSSIRRLISSCQAASTFSSTVASRLSISAGQIGALLCRKRQSSLQQFSGFLSHEMIILSDLSYRGGPGNNCLWPSTVTFPLHALSVVEGSPVAGELLFLQPQGM